MISGEYLLASSGENRPAACEVQAVYAKEVASRGIVMVEQQGLAVIFQHCAKG